MSEEKREDGMSDFMRGIFEEFSQKPGASKKESLSEVAEIMYGQYQAFKVAGFDDEQAFNLTSLILTSIIARM